MAFNHACQLDSSMSCDNPGRWRECTACSIVKMRLARMHNLVNCPRCGVPVHPSYMVAGVCQKCAEAELERLRVEVNERVF